MSYCGVVVGVLDSCVGYCDVVVGVWDCYVGYSVKCSVSWSPICSTLL